MERAKRLAANPLRVIMEAGKSRRRPAADPEPVPVTATVPVVVPAVPTAAAQPAVAATPNTTSAAALVRREEPPPIARPVLQAAPQPAAQPAPQAVVQPAPQLRTLDGANMADGNRVGAVPALMATDRHDLSAAVKLATTTSVAQPALTQPKLIEMVEPAIAQRVLDEIGRLVEVFVDVTIRADGTVANVQVQQPAPRQLVRAVVAAVERWRFAPLPAEQLHRVQLVFNEK